MASRFVSVSEEETKDFKIVDYGRLRQLDAYSVDWVEYGKRARKFAACCHLKCL